ncbi:MAG: efflux RND transporter periplasmic adaptor subunit [bacterium]|nr:efflux RND transporter periplasmic adaptor subunit [bacterium]
MNELKNKIKKWICKSIKLLCVIVILLVIIICINLKPVSVEEHKVDNGPIAENVMGTGTLEAKVNAVISSKITGRIEKVYVDQNDKVKKGQLLVKLDDNEYKRQVDVAKAALNKVVAGLRQDKSDVEKAKAVLVKTKANYLRYYKLRKYDASTQQNFEASREDYAVAKADMASAEASVIETNRKIEEAEQNLKYQEALLEDCYIYAPFDGLVTERVRDDGNISVPGTKILSLISLKVLWVSAWVDETEIDKIRKGQSVNIVFRSEPNHKYIGKVERIAPEVDKETREFIVDVKLLKTPEYWAIGQRAEVYIKTETKNNVTTVPAEYIKWKDNIAGVYINKNGHAKWRNIEIGLRGVADVEIIKGLHDGDLIINQLNSDDKLKNNTRVKVS